MSILKPSPFCGSRPVLQTDTRYPRPACEPRKAYEVVCKNFDCIIGYVDERYRLTEQEAIDAWNRRANGEDTCDLLKRREESIAKKDNAIAELARIAMQYKAERDAAVADMTSMAEYVSDTVCEWCDQTECESGCAGTGSNRGFKWRGVQKEE